MKQIDIIVNNIDKLRKQKGLSIDKLSKEADIPMSTIVKIRQKLVKDVMLSTLTALAKALDCTVDDLIK